MKTNASIRYRARCSLGLLLLSAVAGCQALHHRNPEPAIGPTAVATPVQSALPRELCKTMLPPYRIEPPDILVIEAIHIVPRPPYRLRTMDVIGITVEGTLSESPIAGTYPIELGGVVNLGLPYGVVRVVGLSIDEAREAIRQHLAKSLREPQVSVSLVSIAAQQQIAGQHLVGPDGTVTLGSYGSVPVAGLTLMEAKRGIEEYLSQYLDQPEVSLDVFAYNSKVYYVITQGAGLGDGLYRFPVTGNETVLDAIAQINGLGQASSKKIWIARPTQEPGVAQVLPVDWDAITSLASANTNYQVFPGDRIYVAEDKLIAFDTGLGKLIAPMERIMGFSMLGVGTVTRFSGPVLKGGGNNNSNF